MPRNRTVALVGESGSGKTVISQAILGILPQTARDRARRDLFSDPRTDAPPVDLATLRPRDRSAATIRGSRISIIFQEPMSSLSPLHTIGDQIGEALRLHERAGSDEAAQAHHRHAATGSASPTRRRRSTPIRSSCRAACASGR